jgi:hypothetical protein
MVYGTRNQLVSWEKTTMMCELTSETAQGFGEGPSFLVRN